MSTARDQDTKRVESSLEVQAVARPEQEIMTKQRLPYFVGISGRR
ncbi:MAG: hypothetical protein R2880_21720 [Deinococcales bacterium]